MATSYTTISSWGILPQGSCCTWCNFSFVQSESGCWVGPWDFCSVLPEQGCFLHYLPHVASTHLPLGIVATETVKKAKLWILQNTPCSWHRGSVLNKCTMLKGEAQSTNCTTPMNTFTSMPRALHCSGLTWEHLQGLVTPMPLPGLTHLLSSSPSLVFFLNIIFQWILWTSLEKLIKFPLRNISMPPTTSSKHLRPVVWREPAGEGLLQIAPKET